MNHRSYLYIYIYIKVYSIQNAHDVFVLFVVLVFVVFCGIMWSWRIFFRVASLALGQSSDCPSVCEVILKVMGKIHWCQSRTKHYKVQTVAVCIIHGNFCRLPRQKDFYVTGWETKILWHSPDLGSLLYSLYKIPLAQACFPLARPDFHSHWWAGEC